MSRPITEHAIRRQVVRYAHVLWERGFVANHDGNVTGRAAPGRIVATATGISKGDVAVDNLLVVDEAGRVVAGRFRPFSELGLHLAAYRARPDVGAVVHAHPPHATALAVTGRSLPCFLPEAVVSLGSEVPLVPFALPGKPTEAALERFLEPFDAVLLERHGVLTWGDDVEQAYLRLELVEHLAKIALAALPAGGVAPLNEEMRAPLLAARVRAGLGPEGRRTRER